MKVSILSSATPLTCGLAAAFLLFVGRVQTHAYPGDPDTSFTRIGGINGPIFAVVVDPWTNIWIAGDFTAVAGHTANYIAVLNPDGTFKAAPVWDLNFGGPFRVHALTIGTGQTRTWGVYAAGLRGVARFHWDDLNSVYPQDTSFENPYVRGAGRVSQLNTITIRDTDDTTFVGGQFGMFRLDGTGRTNTMILQPELQNQYITHIRFVPGTVYPPNLSSPEYLLVCGGFGATRIFPTGTSMDDIYYANAGRAYPTVAAERYPGNYYTCSPGHGEFLVGGSLDAGPTYISGSSSGIDGSGLILGRFGFGSDSDTYFPAISSSTNAVADHGSGLSVLEALDGGDMLVGGYLDRIRGTAVNNFAHLLADGSVDPNFRNIAGLVPTAMAIQPDGKYVIVGHNEFTPVTGQIVRRNAMDPPRPVTFTSPPTNQTVYAGDAVYMTAAYDAWPPPSLVWMKNGSELTDFKQSTLSIFPAAVSDSGDYRLRAKAFCTGNHDSEAGHLTVLAAPAPPANDMFNSAISLTGTPVVATGTLRSSTLQAAEPDHAGNAHGHSVWWQWVAPSNGLAVIDISDCDFAAALGVYTGTAVGSLTKIKDNCHLVDGGEGGLYCGGVLPSVSFPVVAGTTYNIAIGGVPGTASLGNIVLRLSYRLILWSQSVSGTTNSLYGAAAGNGEIVAGGYPATILVSTNGTGWAPGNSGITPDASVNGVSFGNGLFLGLTDSGTIASSADGANWAGQTTGVSTSDYLWSAVFGNGLFAAVADEGIVITSPDGTNWTRRATGIGVSTNDSLYSITYGNGLFAAVGNQGTVVTSPDGINWTLQASGLSTSYSFNGIAFGNGRFVAVGDQGKIVTSTDGINWTSETSGLSAYLYAVAHGNGRFVAVGAAGTIILSTDGINWVQDVSGTTVDLYGVCYYQNSQFVIVGDLGTILMNRFPQFALLTLVSNGTIQFSLIGLIGATAIIEATPTLSPPDWQPISTNILMNGATIISASTTNHSSRYYRAKVQ